MVKSGVLKLMKEFAKQFPEKETQADIEHEIMTHGVVEIITEQGLKNRLESGERLRVKYGIDPTITSAHLGHAVPLWKLRQFQKLGHTAVLIIGDYTAQIGDPSGRSKVRKSLSAEQVRKNAEGYFDQINMILDPKRTEIHLQSEWYEAIKLEDVIRLMSRFSYAQIMSHETFAQRAKKGEPLGFHEMIYPILQAYDSVAVKADVELGGIDQRFNFISTRDLQKTSGQLPEEVILTKYLPGIDGREKMSKSLGNTIDLTDTARSMFFKVMSIPDSVMLPYLELATNLPQQAVEQLKQDLEKGILHPMELKKLIAGFVTSLYYPLPEVEAAEEQFSSEVQRKELPRSIPSYFSETPEVNILEFLVSNGLVSSKSEIRRLILQKGIRVDDKPWGDPNLPIKIVNEGVVIKVGKAKFFRILPKES